MDKPICNRHPESRDSEWQVRSILTTFLQSQKYLFLLEKKTLGLPYHNSILNGKAFGACVSDFSDRSWHGKYVPVM